MDYETVIGLEVHVHLQTETKAFCGCSTKFGSEPNSQTCLVCLGFPGSLPVLNEKALEYAIKVALAMNCKVANFTKFDRKNYFYPDLPKNYQISQYDTPLSQHGYLDIKINGEQKRIGIKRIHLEEDAGKLIHDIAEDSSHVDFNRSGAPLLEIVSEPDIHSPEEAYIYLNDLKLLIRYLGVSDCDMEKGSLRCDANISIRKKGVKELGTKSELKNLNSFKAVRDALAFEVERQIELLDNGERVIQETRLWVDEKQKTHSMRSKEEAHDYRYFPEPDLPPFVIGKDWIDKIKATIQELPQARLNRLVKDYGLDGKDAEFLVSDKSLADYFEQAQRLYQEPKKIVNWLKGVVSFELNSRKISFADCPVKPSALIELIEEVQKGTVSNLAAKDILRKMFDTQKSAKEIIHTENLAQVSDEGELDKMIAEAIAENKNSVDAFLSGRENVLSFLIGQVMKRSKGKANPKLVGEMLKRRLRR